MARKPTGNLQSVAKGIVQSLQGGENKEKIKNKLLILKCETLTWLQPEYPFASTAIEEKRWTNIEVVAISSREELPNAVKIMKNDKAVRTDDVINHGEILHTRQKKLTVIIRPIQTYKNKTIFTK